MSLIYELFVPSHISLMDHNKFTKLIIWKNYFLICASNCFYVIATSAVVGVQSTINNQSNLGLASTCVIFAVFGLTAIMLPQILINLIKFKWTLVLGYSLQIFYIALNGINYFCFKTLLFQFYFYLTTLLAKPEWYTYMPGNNRFVLIWKRNSFFFFKYIHSIGFRWIWPSISIYLYWNKCSKPVSNTQ